MGGELFVVTSEESGADKPDPSSFDLALKKLSTHNSEGSTGPIWMIGDNVIADIDGAKKSIDATTLAISSEVSGNADHESIDLLFDAFGDLADYISSSGWDNPSD